MAVKYFYEYKGPRAVNTYRVDIDDVDYAGAAVELQAEEVPFVIRQEPISRIDTIGGSGAELNLISKTSMQLLDLYTTNMQKYKVLFYINGVLSWCGWLDSEMYGEDYARSFNYGVQFPANDGLNLLERLYLYNEFNARYEGIMSAFDVIKLIIQKIALPYTSLYIALSSTIVYEFDGEDVDYVPAEAGESLLHTLEVLTDNYYDELGESMTLREILRAILAPHGAKIRLNPFDNSLYIYDINALEKDTDIVLKKYSCIDFSFIEDVNISQLVNTLDLSNEMEFKGQGQHLDYEDAINKQVINYSPYGVNPILNIKFDADEFLYTDFNRTTLTHGVTNGYKWTEWAYDNNSKYAAFNNGYIIRQNDNNLTIPSPLDYYCKWDNDNNPDDKTDMSNNQPVIKTIMPSPYMIESLNFISIELDAYFRTKEDLNNDSEESATTIRAGYIYAYIKIGDHYFNPEAGQYGLPWSTTPKLTRLAFYSGETADIATSNISDTWAKCRNMYGGDSFVIPLFPALYGYEGTLSVEFVSHFSTSSYLLLDDMTEEQINNTKTTQYKYVKDVRIKNLRVTIKSALPSNIGFYPGSDVVNSDVIIESVLNKQVKNDGPEIDLMHGTRRDGVERAAFMYKRNNQHFYLDRIKRAGITDNAETLLLNTIISNYKAPAVKLSGVMLNSTLVPNPVINLFTDSKHLPNNPKLLALGYEFNPRREEITLNMTEVKRDNLTIVKE